MKKFFKNLAMASSVLLGFLVSSCQLENIETVFMTDPAEARIAVKVVDGLTGDDVTETAVLTYSSTANTVIERDGNELVIKGNKALQEQKVSIHAEFSGRSGDAEVTVHALLAGGQANYGAVIICGKPTVDVARLTLSLVSIFTDYETLDIKNVTKETEFTVTDENGKTYDVGAPTYSDEEKLVEIVSAEAIPAHTFTVKAKYLTNEDTDVVATEAVDLNEDATYYSAFTFGEKPVPGKPVKFIAALRSFDDAEEGSGEVDPESGIVEYTFSRKSATGNTVDIEFSESLKCWCLVVTGDEKDLKVVAEKIIVTATLYPGTAQQESANWTCNVPECDTDNDGTYHDFNFNSEFELDFTPYEPTEKVTVGTFFSTHGHQTMPYPFSHAQIGHGHGEGDGNWLVNETEFMLETEVKYTSTYGTKAATVAYDMQLITVAELAKIQRMLKAYDTMKVEEKTLTIKVSAFSMYTAYATRTVTSCKFDIVRKSSRVIVGSGFMDTYTTQAEYVEAAIPGHEGHYHYGHGHADTHGYSGNAGGGIIWAD